MKLKCSILFLNVLLISVKSELILKQVVILSRHNVRSPLANNLALISPKPWPQWKDKNGRLTAKGALLEGFMGKYFAAWLKREELLPEACPSEKDFFVYANVLQRTLESAKAFVKHGFPSCNITVNHKNSGKDVIFNPVLHDTSATFLQLAFEKMTERLKRLHLNVSYDEIERIIDFKESELCLKCKKCVLKKGKNKIVSLETGKKPGIDGPLRISKCAVDAFIMEYYEGLPVKKVAWGLLTNTTKWNLLMKLSKSYHDVIFNTRIVAKDISKPLVKYLADIFTQNKIKVSLLMGHDANILTILKSLNFKPYFLKKQHEFTPIGGKIVFQKWYDNVRKKYLLKVDYVYQPSRQMREGKELSFENPPEFEPLQLVHCQVDENGFCLWSEFLRILKRLLI